MKQFDIQLRSFEDIQDFVEIATVQPFRIVVGNDRTRVNAKSFMGMFSQCSDFLRCAYAQRRRVKG